MSSTLPSNLNQFESKPPPKEHGAPVGGIVVTIILALALIAIIFVAVTRLTSGGLSRPSAAPTVAASSPAQATVQAAGTPADAATQQTIQQVITQVNQAQVQAVQTGDPSVMAPTATAEFYQDQVATNQDLVDGGVTDIKLINIEWGPILVNGNTAVATDYETWSTTLKDGTTEQSRDRNVYTLVNDNGTWKVQADDHPDQQSSGNQAPGLPGAP
jgi:ketosteroid isomerase-like protein